jgi:hypothetical protein
MSKLTGEELQEAHNKGQEDGTENHYDNPHRYECGGLFGHYDKDGADAYDDGWNHAYKQR